MKRLTDKIFIDPKEVQAIEAYDIDQDAISGLCGFRFRFQGSVITLKITGRKIYVKELNPQQILEILRDN